MDTGNGTFTQLVEEAAAMKSLEAEHPNHGGWFQIGDIVKLNGSTFRIKAIKPTELRLKLLPKDWQKPLTQGK